MLVAGRGDQEQHPGRRAGRIGERVRTAPVRRSSRFPRHVARLVRMLVSILVPMLPGSTSPTRRSELAGFLRAQRARLTPADVGLTEGSASGRRRTPGLRREEVAQLSGVGVTWYTWLEQGREITASIQVVDALARALLLTADQYRHLRELAGLPPPEPQALAADALPRLQLLVDAVAPSPASVYDARFDYLVWNGPYARVRHDPATPPAGR